MVEGVVDVVVGVVGVVVVVVMSINRCICRPQLKVRTKDLQQCTEMATGVDSMGQFQFGDMVQIE